MEIGAPLPQALTVTQLTAVIGHAAHRLTAQATTDAAQLDANRLLEAAGGDTGTVLRLLFEGRPPLGAGRGVMVAGCLVCAGRVRRSWGRGGRRFRR
ncbi:hypothetical protein [Dactylosporangium sp. NPDC000521]|uniref:hypothetical protein n=1 Tax=Dactylosporangium sp. NPDC000521 TaxID=3363975 RepID=UPI003679CDAF